MPRDTLYAFSAHSLSGELISLERYRGQVVLIVNVASRCGYTPQYAGLQELYRDFHDCGFTVLAFPCNQFGRQEPGGADEIRDFCTRNFGVEFPIFEKIDVNGPRSHALYNWLKKCKPGLLGTRRIKWNFTKFLVGRDGHVLARHAPATRPAELRAAIRTALKGTP